MSIVTRREMLRLGAGGGAVLAAVLTGGGVRPRPAQAGGLLETFDVVPDLGSFDAVRTPAEGAAVPTGPFHVRGSIYRENSLDGAGALRAGSRQIGTFHCWGWIHDGQTGAAVVSQAYEIWGRGNVQVQGSEVPGFRATVGGEGELSGVHAGWFQTINAANLTFRATFDR